MTLELLLGADIGLSEREASGIVGAVQALIGDGRIGGIEPISDEPWKTKGRHFAVTFERGRDGPDTEYEAFVALGGDSTAEEAGGAAETNGGATAVPVFAISGGGRLEPLLERSALDFRDGIRLLARFHVDSIGEEVSSAFNWDGALQRSFADRLSPDGALYCELKEALGVTGNTFGESQGVNRAIHGDAHYLNFIGDDGSSLVRYARPADHYSTIFSKNEVSPGYVIDVDKKRGDIADDVALYVVSVLTDPQLKVTNPEELERSLVGLYVVKHNQFCAELGQREEQITDVEGFMTRYQNSKKKHLVRWLGTKLDRMKRCSGTQDQQRYRDWAKNISYMIEKSGDDLLQRTVASAKNVRF